MSDIRLATRLFSTSLRGVWRRGLRRCVSLLLVAAWLALLVLIACTTQETSPLRDYVVKPDGAYA